MQRAVNDRNSQDDFSSPHHLGTAVSDYLRGLRCSPALAINIVIALLLSLLTSFPAQAENARSYVELGAGYMTGDFGTPTKSSLNYLSSTIGHIEPDYDVSVTVPYLSLTSKFGSQSQTESGVGDMILRFGRVLVHEGAGGLSLDGALSVKIPTADEMKGLGTGETDFGAFLGLHQRLGGFKVSFHGGYIKVGDPPHVNYNDIYLYGIGISKISGFTELYANLEGRQASVRGAKNPKEIYIGFFHVLNIDYAIRGSAFTGLNDGGPDLGFNVGLVRWF